MDALKISNEQWAVLKQKVLRKYNHLSEEDLAFEPGQEAQLVERLAKRIHRKPDYVLFTLQKGLADLDGNRL
jgi:hypothetical protein